jgi:hypothetical protein
VGKLVMNPSQLCNATLSLNAFFVASASACLAVRSGLISGTFFLFLRSLGLRPSGQEACVPPVQLKQKRHALGI